MPHPIERRLALSLALAATIACSDRTPGPSASEATATSTTGSPGSSVDPQSSAPVSGTGSTTTAPSTADTVSPSTETTGSDCATSPADGTTPPADTTCATTDTPPLPNPFVSLLGPPFLFAPTSDSFGINVVAADGEPSRLRVRVRQAGAEAFEPTLLPQHPAPDVAQWTVTDLQPATEYDYIVFSEDEEEQVLASGRAVTQRPPGQPFTFTLITDSHIEPRRHPIDYTAWVPADLSTDSDFAESTLLEVGRDMEPVNADFLFNLGDILDFHLFGFNLPPPDATWTRAAYMNYRRLLNVSLTKMPHFNVVGNWDGENGNFTAEQIAYSRKARMTYAPGPKPDTYPQGGNDAEDYYAFTWGDALFVTLNVMTYTPTEHLLSYTGAEADDWTLGEKQLLWLEKTLEEATSKWRFILIHHSVGGAAGTDYDSVYGRGGGQAAYVGEQAIVHDLMLKHGVQVFFYGHDHVFTDMVVDGIHYTLPGSAGAPWKFTTTETGYETYWPDSGHARVAVAPDSLSVEFIAVGGELLYRYELDETGMTTPDPDAADAAAINTPMPDAGAINSAALDASISADASLSIDASISTDASLN